MSPKKAAVGADPRPTASNGEVFLAAMQTLSDDEPGAAALMIIHCMSAIEMQFGTEVAEAVLERAVLQSCGDRLT